MLSSEVPQNERFHVGLQEGSVVRRVPVFYEFSSATMVCPVLLPKLPKI